MHKFKSSFIALFFLITCTGFSQTQSQWHYPLYLANMGYWHSRIPVEIINNSAFDIKGEPVKIKIGSISGELPLNGSEAGEIRLVDSKGVGLLWKIISLQKEIITEGPVPAESEFVLPATQKAGEKEEYYVYFNNPATWPEGAVLENDPAVKHDTDQNADVSKKLQAIVKAVETIDLKKENGPGHWPEDKQFDIRVPVRIFNFSEKPSNHVPVYVRMEQVYQRFHEKGYGSCILQAGNGPDPHQLCFGNAMIFENQQSPFSEKTVFAYLKQNRKEELMSFGKKFSAWSGDKRNLAKNPVREYGSKSEAAAWKTEIPIEPGKTYMFGAMAICSESGKALSVKIKLTGSQRDEIIRHADRDPADGQTGWKFVSGVFIAPDSAVEATMNLSLSDSGMESFKGMIMMEVMEGYASSMFFEARVAKPLDKLTVWPVNTLVKVFREDLPPVTIPQAAISLACNETEPLQIALRSPYRCNKIRVEAGLPVNSSGLKLTKVNTFLEGYVPVDYPSNYYERKVPYWHLKFPAEAIGSDGWAGYWPDPLMPLKTFDLEPYKTQPLWIEVTVPEGTPEGIYSGDIKIFINETLANEIPWKVHVRNFSLPVRNSFGALYDYRSMEDMPAPGPDHFRTDITGDSLRKMYLSFMASHRISSGEINPVPKINYSDGKVIIDFTEYDRAASVYFDELKNPFAYLPVNIFYLFGWAFPPSEKFGEKPYPGNFPYKDADRGKLRPEYKKAYQTVLKTFWEHVREKGWADRYILYLSDEPHEADNNDGRSDDIRKQMKALCNMIHEVDPKIPIYVSTWWYRPEWEGYIDVWGLGFNGEGDYGHYVTAEDMKHITSSGGRIWYTTDGNFCTETPYLALERLLPWFGYKYGAEAYEFWGVNWLTLNPFKYGWHSYIYESQAPGEESWKRYPNGDGFIIYPGKPAGEDGLIGSIRLKQVREGAEDYEYFTLLGHLIDKADPINPGLKAAREAMQNALELVNIPCAMGRYSTRILKDPDDVLRIREKVAESIEMLTLK